MVEVTTTDILKVLRSMYGDIDLPDSTVVIDQDPYLISAGGVIACTGLTTYYLRDIGLSTGSGYVQDALNVGTDGTNVIPHTRVAKTVDFDLSPAYLRETKSSRNNDSIYYLYMTTRDIVKYLQLIDDVVSARVSKDKN